MHSHMTNSVKIDIERSRRLKGARIAAGYKTMKLFVDAHGLTEVTYRSHENGTRNVTYNAAQIYAKYLNVTTEWIMDGKSNISASSKFFFDQPLMEKSATAIQEAAKRMNIKLDLAQAMANTVKLYNHIKEFREKGEEIDPSVSTAVLILRSKSA